MKGCGAKGTSVIICKECGGWICIQHRHGEDHECPSSVIQMALREHDLKRQKENKFSFVALRDEVFFLLLLLLLLLLNFVVFVIFLFFVICYLLSY